MKKRNTGHSSNFIHASKVKLPDCDATADTIVQMLVEGYPDGFTQRARSVEKPVAGRKEAA
ncbi:MAG: hypothetical protein LCH99_15620 [Proteobacteria bacterium]|nr:hypothetical protein [Pseudomonadota bacterium]